MITNDRHTKNTTSSSFTESEFPNLVPGCKQSTAKLRMVPTSTVRIDCGVCWSVANFRLQTYEITKYIYLKRFSTLSNREHQLNHHVVEINCIVVQLPETCRRPGNYLTNLKGAFMTQIGCNSLNPNLNLDSIRDIILCSASSSWGFGGIPTGRELRWNWKGQLVVCIVRCLSLWIPQPCLYFNMKVCNFGKFSNRLYFVGNVSGTSEALTLSFKAVSTF